MNSSMIRTTCLVAAAMMLGIVAPARAGDGCAADLNGDGSVGFPDLLQLLATWGSCPGCSEDLDEDSTVGFSDLLLLLASWGPVQSCLFIDGCQPSEVCRETVIQVTGQGFGIDPDDICLVLMPEKLVTGRVFSADDGMLLASVGDVPDIAGPGQWMVALGQGTTTSLPAGSILSNTEGWAWEGDLGPAFEDACEEIVTPIPFAHAGVLGGCNPDDPTSTQLFAYWEVDNTIESGGNAILVCIPPGPYLFGTNLFLDGHFDIVGPSPCGGHRDAYIGYPSGPPLTVGVISATAAQIANELAARLQQAFHNAGQTDVFVVAAGPDGTCIVLKLIGFPCKIDPGSVGGNFTAIP